MTAKSATAIVLVGHGDTAAALLAAAVELAGPLVDVVTVACPREDSRSAIEGRLRDAVDGLPPSAALLFVTDLKGSTPHTLCRLEASRRLPRQAAVLCGLSLPMLLKLTTARFTEQSSGALATALAATATRAIDVEVFSS